MPIWMLVAAVCSGRTVIAPAPQQAELITLKNRFLTAGFDPRTGAWMQLLDGRTGDDLVAGPPVNALVTPSTPPELPLAPIVAALSTLNAIDLAGRWLYTPVPPPEEKTAAFLKDDFVEVPWAATPVPSRSGVGDDRLKNRTGDFWYRCEFTCPPSWHEDTVALVLGAVDDFDVTYVNGTRIGATGVETAHHWEAPRCYRFPARLLRTDRPNTLLIKVTNAAFSGGIAGPVVLGPASVLPAPVVTGPPLTEHSISHKGGRQTLAMVNDSDGLEYRTEFVLADDRAALTRQVTVTNTSQQEKLFQTSTAFTPPLSVGPNQAIAFPGSLPVGDSPFDKVLEGETLVSRSQDPLAVLWDAGKRRGIGLWYHCEEEYSPVSVRRSGGGMEIRHRQDVVVRLKPGSSVTLGKQYLWLCHGTRDDVLCGVQAVYKEIGLRAPANGLTDLASKTIYCGHPGGTPEQSYRTYGGFKAVQNYLPTLKKMGIDLIWLLPIWEHGDGVKWNLYSPFDHFKVSPIYGTPGDLKSLSAACASDDIRLMFDLVPHGPPDFTPLAKEHPEWICRDADGKMIYAWEQYAFDNAHPGWQDYFRRVAAWDAEQYGGIGARVDCGAGGPMNWNPEFGNRPSLSTLAGGLGMNRAIREGFLKLKKEVVLLPEEYTGANIFYRVADLTYDEQLYYLMMELQDRKASPEEWAHNMQTFLHDQQQTLPPGALKMRWISNHDTVSWTFQKQRPMRLYGQKKMQALLALCALIEGVPMLYQGDENPAVYRFEGPSNVDFVAKLYGLRKKLPSLRGGQADYELQADNGVFACLRRAKGRQALVLISFNPEAATSRVHGLPETTGRWKDQWSGETVSLRPGADIRMEPYGIRILTPVATAGARR